MVENYNDGYYHFGKDFEDYPEADIFIVWSKRGPGKTYSALRYAHEHNKRIVYLRRTLKDIQMITSTGPNGEDRSPYAPLNRDLGWNIKPVITKDSAAFYEADSEGSPCGLPVADLIALSQVKDVKGFNMADCDWIIFDEFVPIPGTVTRRAEGEMFLSIYDSIARDRIKRGKEPVKLILFANAEDVSTSITRAMEVIDDLVEVTYMNTPIHIKYDMERGAVYHHISIDELPMTNKEASRGLARFMKNTSWYEKEYIGHFTNNDFTSINKRSLKNARPYIHLIYKRYDYYVYLYEDTGKYYICSTQSKNCLRTYNLNRENEQKKFYLSEYFELRNSCIDDRMQFEKYSMYDLILNYKDYFDI